MIKLLLLCLVSSFAYAYPSLGDFVRYEAKYEGSMIKMERKVLSHDTVQNTFEVRTLVIYQDRIIQDDTHVLPHSFLYTPEKVASVIKNCYAREGMLTNMVIQNKKLTVCEFYDEGSQLTNMIGPVPFGLVRFQNYLQGEEFLDFNLTYFSSL
jgi:hypothetical protein